MYRRVRHDLDRVCEDDGVWCKYKMTSVVLWVRSLSCLDVPTRFANMSPIRTRRARAARGGRENRLVPEAAATTPAKSAFEFKKYPQTPRSARTAAPRKVAHRRSTIFVIEQAGKQQRHILADRRVQVNVAQDLVQRRKTIEPVHKPDESPDSPETDVLDSELDSEEDEGDEERHVHWTDGIKNKAGSVVLPPLVPPMHFPLLRNKVRLTSARLPSCVLMP